MIIGNRRLCFEAKGSGAKREPAKSMAAASDAGRATFLLAGNQPLQGEWGGWITRKTLGAEASPKILGVLITITVRRLVKEDHVLRSNRREKKTKGKDEKRED